MLESKFQAKLIKDLEEIFLGCVIMKNDSGYRQGFPDLLILFNDRWATLECKAYEEASVQPNQVYWVTRLDQMSFSCFVYPENRDDVLNALIAFFS